MSLSSHLESKDDPVRDWFKASFPETRRVATDANRLLNGGVAECPLPRPPGADPSLVGTAIDYLLRCCLRVTSVDSTFATKAAQLLATDPSIDIRAIEVEREAVTDIRRLQPSRRDLIDAEWSELCVRCLVLARLEQFYRAGPMNPAIFELLIEPLRQCKGLDDFIPMTLKPPTIQDLERLGRAARDDSRWLRRARPLVLNPQFHLSAELGGADADLIARRRLIDWKATTKRGIVSRLELWQLLGYVLADTNDEYRIREVSIAALRWRSVVSWPLDELLQELAPGPPMDFQPLKGDPLQRKSMDLAALRDEFAQVVRQSHIRQEDVPARMPARVSRKDRQSEI